MKGNLSKGDIKNGFVVVDIAKDDEDVVGQDVEELGRDVAVVLVVGIVGVVVVNVAVVAIVDVVIVVGGLVVVLLAGDAVLLPDATVSVCFKATAKFASTFVAFTFGAPFVAVTGLLAVFVDDVASNSGRLVGLMLCFVGFGLVTRRVALPFVFDEEEYDDDDKIFVPVAVPESTCPVCLFLVNASGDCCCCGRYLFAVVLGVVLAIVLLRLLYFIEGFLVVASKDGLNIGCLPSIDNIGIDVLAVVVVVVLVVGIIVVVEYVSVVVAMEASLSNCLTTS